MERTTAWLRLDTDAAWARFSASADGQAWQAIGQGECGLLAAEVAGGFTGVLLGLYAQGQGRACAGPAAFDLFSHTATAAA